MSHVTVGDTEELFGTRTLRWFQVAARNAVADTFVKNPIARVLVVLPTGSGKTLTNGSILLSPVVREALSEPGKPLRVLFIAHMHRLLTQAERAYFDEDGIVTVTADSKSACMFTDAPVSPSTAVEIYYHSVFSSIPEGLHYDLIILDEAHHESVTTLQYKLEEIGGKPILGLTATHIRADKHMIKFDTIVSPITREEAVQQGYLAKTHLHSFVDIGAGCKAPVLCDIFDSYVHQMDQTMVFVRTKKEVELITKHLVTNIGVSAVGLLSQTSKELDRILDRFSDGKIQMIVNCARIGEGVDVRGCSNVVIGRTVGSYPLLNQLIGRAARPDSDCHVWELIDPLSGRNLDTTVVVGVPEQHRLVAKERGVWVEREFVY